MSVQSETVILTAGVAAPSSPLTIKKILRITGTLFKLRIVTLLLFAATGGAFLGAAGKPSFGELMVLFVTGGLSASGASALNQYIERHKDASMKRTRERPLVNGDIPHPQWILGIALGMIIVPALLVLGFNPALALFNLLGAFIYVVIYTLWLKPRTILNIVIGGAAGSCAVLSGGAAVGAWNDPGVMALAGILFLWTPTHFWSLAILYKDDYTRADIPMLPTRVQPRDAALWGLLHAVTTSLLAVILGVHAALGFVYIIPTLFITYYFMKQSIRLVIHPEPKQALRHFLASNGYLAALLLFICIAGILGI